MQQVENELLWFFRVSLSYMFMEFWKLVKSNDVLEKCAQSSVSTLFVALSRHGNKKGNITLFYLKIKVKELAYMAIWYCCQLRLATSPNNSRNVDLIIWIFFWCYDGAADCFKSHDMNKLCCVKWFISSS